MQKPIENEKLLPGRSLDALVAEKVMGYRRKQDDCNTYWVDEDGLEPTHNQDYSTSIEAAWKVVEKIREKGLQFELRISPGTLWVVWISKLSLVPFKEDKLLAEIKTETAPHAICLAALEIVGVKLE